jgi:hypothetical protein
VDAGTATDLTSTSSYPAGTVVDIQAIANPSFEFVNWTASAGIIGNATAATTTFTIPTQNVTVTANFVTQFARGSGTAYDPYQINEE